MITEIVTFPIFAIFAQPSLRASEGRHGGLLDRAQMISVRDLKWDTCI